MPRGTKRCNEEEVRVHGDRMLSTQHHRQGTWWSAAALHQEGRVFFFRVQCLSGGQACLSFFRNVATLANERVPICRRGFGGIIIVGCLGKGSASSSSSSYNNFFLLLYIITGIDICTMRGELSEGMLLMGQKDVRFLRQSTIPNAQPTNNISLQTSHSN